MSMDIASRIDLAMSITGMKTQSELSRVSGVPESTLTRILKNAGQPNIENLIAISAALNRSLDWIVSGTDSPQCTLPELINVYVTHEELRLIQQLRESTPIGKSSILTAGNTSKKLEKASDSDQS